MEIGASVRAEEEGGIVVGKGKDEEAKVLEPRLGRGRKSCWE